MKRVVMACLASVALGCSPMGTGSTTSSSSGGGGGGLSAGEFYFELLSAQCDHAERCVATNGRAHSDRQACVDQYSSQVRLFLTAFGVDITETLDGVLEVTDQDAAQRCLTAVRETMPCEDEDPLVVADCQAAVRAPNGRSEGQSCLGSPLEGDRVTFCDIGLSCEFSGGTGCGTCTREKEIGEACTQDSECRSQSCQGDAGSMTCRALPGRGEACSGGCAGHLLCRGPSGMQTCQERKGEGEACEFDCYLDLECVDEAGGSVCRASKADGAACTPQDELPCRNFCVPSSTTTLNGTCQSLTAMPGAGSSCVYQGNQLLCAYGSYPVVSDGGMACTCQTLQADGASCTRSSECQSGACGRAPGASTGTCGAKFPNGTPCNQDQECASGSCNPDAMGAENSCGPPPMCQ